jgi:hypothetical protein
MLNSSPELFVTSDLIRYDSSLIFITPSVEEIFKPSDCNGIFNSQLFSSLLKLAYQNVKLNSGYLEKSKYFLSDR